MDTTLHLVSFLLTASQRGDPRYLSTFITGICYVADWRGTEVRMSIKQLNFKFQSNPTTKDNHQATTQGSAIKPLKCPTPWLPGGRYFI
jgi:hypothetical protein